MQSALISDSQNLQLRVLNSGIAEVHQFLQPVPADANSAKYATAEAYTKRNFGYRRRILPKFVILMKCTKKTNLGRICLRYRKFRFVYASALTHFTEFASAGTAAGIGELRLCPLFRTRS